MTKAEFVKKYAQEAGLPPTQAAKAVQAFWDTVEASLKSGEPVQFAGYGKFSVSQRASRQGVNPRDPGKRIQIPARKVPKFTPGTLLKRAVDTPAKRGGGKKATSRKKK
jgi:DNA-binding protein HU-beta